eukprot:5897735-Pleurochrysis_carterae.AAC.1
MWRAARKKRASSSLPERLHLTTSASTLGSRFEYTLLEVWTVFWANIRVLVALAWAGHQDEGRAARPTYCVRVTCAALRQHCMELRRGLCGPVGNMPTREPVLTISFRRKCARPA